VTAHPHRETVGVVLGSQDAGPLEFWIGVLDEAAVQLDDLIAVDVRLADGTVVTFFGVVDLVRKRYEGAQFDSDAFRAAAGMLPVEVSYAARVQVTRVVPEVFVPPHPGTEAFRVRGAEFQRALFIDQMERKIPIGFTRIGGRTSPSLASRGLLPRRPTRCSCSIRSSTRMRLVSMPQTRRRWSST
jgi:uncharacterized protein